MRLRLIVFGGISTILCYFLVPMWVEASLILLQQRGVYLKEPGVYAITVAAFAVFWIILLAALLWANKNQRERRQRMSGFEIKRR